VRELRESFLHTEGTEVQRSFHAEVFLHFTQRRGVFIERAERDFSSHRGREETERATSGRLTHKPKKDS